MNVLNGYGGCNKSYLVGRFLAALSRFFVLTKKKHYVAKIKKDRDGQGAGGGNQEFPVLGFREFPRPESRRRNQAASGTSEGGSRLQGLPQDAPLPRAQRQGGGRGAGTDRRSRHRVLARRSFGEGGFPGPDGFGPRNLQFPKNPQSTPE